MMATINEQIGVFCVDDNALVIEALRIKLSRTPGFTFSGWLASAEGLADRAAADHPAIILLDLDMPGKDPLTALAEVAQRSPETRVVIFSGHVLKDLIDRALDAGAWGYVSKNDGEDALMEALRKVARSELGLSPEVRATIHL